MVVAKQEVTQLLTFGLLFFLINTNYLPPTISSQFKPVFFVEDVSTVILHPVICCFEDCFTSLNKYLSQQFWQDRLHKIYKNNKVCVNPNVG